MLKVLKKVGFVLLMAAGYVLTAALFLWFWPMMLQMIWTGEWERNRNYIKKIHRIQEQVRHEIYLRRQHEARAKRAWENRNNFFKESEKVPPAGQRGSFQISMRRTLEEIHQRNFENRNNFYKETKK